MATSITKEGFKLVKEEVPEVTLEDDNELSLNNEGSKEQPIPQASSTDIKVVSDSTNLVKEIRTARINKEKELEEPLAVENKDGKENEPEDEGLRVEEIEYDDDEDEGNLMIDDGLDDDRAQQNIISKISKVVQKDTQNHEKNEAKTNGSLKEDVMILPNPNLIDEIEDEECNDDSSDKGDKEVVLEKLPRPVNELNCRQSRTYLVKLLRAANGGLNPHYGNPEMKPAFWPDYYWPWAKLTDVHTKPRGMNEPLQYR